MKAIILAGGKGTRLGPLTAEIPKPMVPIAGKPVIHRQIDFLKRYGFRDIILITNHLSHVLEEYLGDGKDFGVQISYVVEPRPLGTVGGIKIIEEELSTDFLVLYGDVMIDMDLNRLLDFHRQHQSEATLVVHPNDHPYDSDLVELGPEDRIVNFHAKPRNDDRYYANMVNGGLYVFSAKVLTHLQKNVKADFGRDIFPTLYQKIRLYGYNTPEYMKDMGTPDRLEVVTQAWESGKIRRLNLENKRRAIFLDRDGVINRHAGHIYKPEQFELYPHTADAIRLINQSEYMAVVVTNQPVIARNLCSEAELKNIHNKMESQLGDERTKLDAIYYCPHHPDGGFPEERPEFKIDCDCRKPKPGMLLDAAKRFNIDLEKSFIIGDSWRDIGAGKAAGVQTIGVMTGDGNREGAIRPDYLVKDLLHAVRLILEDPYRSYAEQVAEIIGDYRSEPPYILAIGGNSRAGKSSLASYLANFLRQNVGSVFRINLDNWIIPKSERPENDDVFIRFQSEQLNSDLESILNGEPVTLDHPYTMHKDMVSRPETYTFRGEDIVVIEGVVALALPKLENRANYKIHVDISPSQVKERMIHLYHWKGYTDDAEIEALHKKRVVDEYEVINKLKSRADLIVNGLTL